VDAHAPDLMVDVRIRENRATVSIDLAGGSLYRRTYFDEHDGQDAPLACAFAAGVLMAAGAPARLREGWGLLDPACDAGFIVCEAALMAADAAPGLLRERWGFYGWAQHDDEAWGAELARADERFERGLERLLAEAGAQSAGSLPNGEHVRIVGLSSSSPAVTRARAHLRNAGLRAVASIEAEGVDGAAAVCARVAGVVRDARGKDAVSAKASDAAEPARAADCVDLDDVDSAANVDFAVSAAPALVVATAAAADRDENDARAVAETAAFMAAARTAPAGSVFAAATVRGLQARFGVEPALKTRVGRERIAEVVEVFDEPPAAPAHITVPDPQGGADHVVEVNDANAAQFAARLRKVARERRKWARREGVTSYRLYDADLPDYNVAIDLYEGAGAAEGKTFVHVAEYQAPASIDAYTARCRFDDVLAVVPVALGVRPDHVFSKVRERSKGGSQYRDAGRRSYVTCVGESGLLFEVDLAGYLDTGIFLDHRETRRMVGGMAKGARFLNLFAYTGTASVYAAAGGAVETTTVDLSQTYLDWARRNMEMNGFPESREDVFVSADVMTWIRDARRSRLAFDLVFVDPPTFSNSKSMGRRTWDVQRDHVELLIGVSRLLAKGGVAVFSCNLRTFKPNVEELEKYGVKIEDVTAKTIPHDFERNPRIHQCYLVTRA
ncbi:MAG: class I SAM-dependent methyltransferase, partial [Eggerthellaceae bacterium]|nr:class I SAM-dependent methyltransferase [Eggerthellaceae bacterium]